LLAFMKVAKGRSERSRLKYKKFKEIREGERQWKREKRGSMDLDK